MNKFLLLVFIPIRRDLAFSHLPPVRSVPELYPLIVYYILPVSWTVIMIFPSLGR